MSETGMTHKNAAQTRGIPHSTAKSVVGHNKELSYFSEKLNDHARTRTGKMINPKTNETGLPDYLKAAAEAKSKVALDAVRVHYNSEKPALYMAHAFASGNEIHVAKGQERFLAHEVWHVVQQSQGRVRQGKIERNGMRVNADPSLESEADTMAAKLSSPARQLDPQAIKSSSLGTPSPIVQLKPIPQEGPAETHNYYNAVNDSKLEPWNYVTKPTFGTALYKAVIAHYQGLYDGEKETKGEKSETQYIAAYDKDGNYVPAHKTGVQLDHAPSWEERKTRFLEYQIKLNRTTSFDEKSNCLIFTSDEECNLYDRGYFIFHRPHGLKLTTYAARMYYNDFDSLKPVLATANAAAGASGISVKEPKDPLANQAIRQALSNRFFILGEDIQAVILDTFLDIKDLPFLLELLVGNRVTEALEWAKQAISNIDKERKKRKK